MYELLLRANILYPLSSSSETDFYQQKSLVPCMLPNTSPDLKFLWPKRTLREGKNVVWHRRFCLNCSLPVGAMPRILTYLLNHPSFIILSRWKNGCIVRYERWEKGKDLVGRIKIEKVVLDRGDALDVDVLWLPNESTQNLNQTDEVYEFIFERKELLFFLVASLFRSLSSLFETLLSEFYHVRYLIRVEVSPGKWVTLKQLRNHQAGSKGLEHIRLDTIAPDLYFLDLRSNKRFLIDWDELAFEVRRLFG